MRKIVQIATSDRTGKVIALCGDGTLWERYLLDETSDRWNYISTAEIADDSPGSSISTLEAMLRAKEAALNNPIKVPSQRFGDE